MSIAADTVRKQIETALSKRIPYALTPMPRLNQQFVATGMKPIDDVLQGGLPLGAITEIVGPECSGRTSLVLSYITRMTKASCVCAWVDASDTLNPESAAAAGIDLRRLLWVRCGVTHPTSASYPSRGSIPTNKLSTQMAVSTISSSSPCADNYGFASNECDAKQSDGIYAHTPAKMESYRRPVLYSTPPSRIDDALRVTDLILQCGGFNAIILDLGGITPEYALRVPLATWFRYRAAAERTQVSIVLITQYACAKSSANLVIRLDSGEALKDESTVFTGMDHRLIVARQRSAPMPGNIIPLRKPPQREAITRWTSRSTWVGTR